MNHTHYTRSNARTEDWDKISKILNIPGKLHRMIYFRGTSIDGVSTFAKHL